MGKETVMVGETPVALRDMWTTPEWLVVRLRARYGITMDAAATLQTAIVPSYWGPDHGDPVRRDSLRTEAAWTTYGTSFLNPPFGQSGGTLTDWVDASIRQSRIRPVVLLVPDTVSCRWFKKAYDHAATVTFFDGRVGFDPPPGVAKSSPRGGVVVFHFVPETFGPARVQWDTVPRSRS